jgi:hypothetical protein
MGRCGARTYFKNSDGARRSVRFVQRTRLGATWRHVGENSDNTSVGIKPNEVKRESHSRHPDWMSAGCLPLQQKSVDAAQGHCQVEAAAGRVGR